MTDTAAAGERHDPILEVEGVEKAFGGIRALNGATLDVREGSITALIGPNGAGKTTLFNVIAGFFRADRGSIRFRGEELFGKPAFAVARRGMVRTFQITKALARMPVLDNMMLAAPSQPGESISGLLLRPRASRSRERDVRDRAMELLDRFDLDRVAQEYAGTLSGGQRKLLEMARALMTEPRLLLLDEPMAGINPSLGQRLLEHMARLREEAHMTFLFIEHDMEVVMGHSDRVLVMANGAVIADGDAQTVKSDRAVVDAYLGTLGGTAGVDSENGAVADAGSAQVVGPSPRARP